ncbi:unnamed protein product [Rhizophagus irregularis]|nr:unnamed protein product [Rhizophagus irregularis]
MCWPLKSQCPSITKMNLTHDGHSLNPEIIQFANVYRQIPQDVMNKIEFHVNTIHGINQHMLRQLLQESSFSSILDEPTLYLRHHDVILTDNTARTNKYHLSLCLFVGVDEHRHSRVIAQALMSDETTSSYMWVLNNFLAATNYLAPRTIFSNCDTGLGPAIESVFPTTRYLHCIFHIALNIKKNLMRLLSSQFTAFKNDFFIYRNILFEEIF